MSRMLRTGEGKMTGRMVWTCKIGETARVPAGADTPMRDAVTLAYRAVTGADPIFLFSGWGGELNEGERAAVEKREPDPRKVTMEVNVGQWRALNYLRTVLLRSTPDASGLLTVDSGAIQRALEDFDKAAAP